MFDGNSACMLLNYVGALTASLMGTGIEAEGFKMNHVPSGRSLSGSP